MSNNVLSAEVWQEALASIPDGYRFSSLHINEDEPDVWKASVYTDSPRCSCCGVSQMGGLTWIVGSGASPDAALVDLTRQLGAR